MTNTIWIILLDCVITEPMKVFAIHCHPDDIEFTMAGTLLLLKAQGHEIHYMNLANGCYGTTEHNKAEIIAIRRQESLNSTERLGAIYHESICDDLNVFYDGPTIARLCAVVREVAPDIVLTAPPNDYMEDHMNTCRIALTAVFARNVPLYPSNPNRSVAIGDTTIYHAMPHGLRDGLRNQVLPEICVDVSSVIEQKTALLACHQSQKSWLDASQGFNSYLETMRHMAAELGHMSRRFQYAEGWRRHLHLGYARREGDPLTDLLAESHCPNRSLTGRANRYPLCGAVLSSIG